MTPHGAPAATALPTVPPRLPPVVITAAWIALALPALYQIGLVVHAIAGRAGYPYDLEWMEGGMLHHALRIRLGLGIYVAPNVDFVPYLYTPLYPTLLALFGGPFGISYALGRAVSIIALVGIAGTALAALVGAPSRPRGPALVGATLAVGVFAAFYPYVDGWYDLVRADTLFLFMVTAGLAGLPHWARSDGGWVGHGKVAAGAAVMALAFFCKQTGIFYVALGGAIVVVANWRRAPTYAAMAGAIGLGGCWMLDRSTGGWFWTYVSEIHRAHDFNLHRFWASFGNILWHFPAPTVIIAITLGLVAATARRRGTPPAARAFLHWTLAYAVSIVVGAIGWGTEFAHFNAYMPAHLHGAIAAGAAIPAALACGRALARDHRRAAAIATACGLAAALPIAATCALARWEPRRYIPGAGDVAAGARLIRRIGAIQGDVWVPSHPWYAVLAGKIPHVHRMGIKDVTARQTRTVERLDDQLRQRRFAAIVLDNRDVQLEVPGVAAFYHRALALPADERPRLYSGAGSVTSGNLLVPDTIWLPTPPPPSAAAVSPATTAPLPDAPPRPAGSAPPSASPVPGASPRPAGSAPTSASPPPAGSAPPSASPPPAGSAPPSASPRPAGSAPTSASPRPAGSAPTSASPPPAAPTSAPRADTPALPARPATGSAQTKDAAAPH